MSSKKLNSKNKKQDEIVEIKIPNAYGYRRVSTGMQQSDGASLQTQTERITEECNHRKLNLVRIFEDALSGKEMDNRTGLNELLKVAKEGDYVIITDISRLTRKTKDALTILEDFNEKGIKLICLNPAMDFTTPSGLMIFTVMVAMHAMERQNTAANVAINMKRLSEAGELRSRAPFGYKFVGKDKDFEPVESQQELIKRIITMYTEGVTPGKIAKKLNEEGENVKLLDNKPPQKREKPPIFYDKTIRRILIDQGILENTEGAIEERKPLDQRIVSYNKDDDE